MFVCLSFHSRTEQWIDVIFGTEIVEGPEATSYPEINYYVQNYFTGEVVWYETDHIYTVIGHKLGRCVTNDCIFWYKYFTRAKIRVFTLTFTCPSPVPSSRYSIIYINFFPKWENNYIQNIETTFTFYCRPHKSYSATEVCCVWLALSRGPYLLQ